MRKILILGATGTLGKSIVPALKDAGHELTLVSRHIDKALYPDSKCMVCDATCIVSLAKAIEGQDIVICAISGESLPTIAENLAGVMNTNIKRQLIFMGAVGIYNEIPKELDDEDNVDNNPEQYPNRKAVDVIEASNLDYTIIRPGYLKHDIDGECSVTFKGETATGYMTPIRDVVDIIKRMVEDDRLYSRQSIAITLNMTK